MDGDSDRAAAERAADRRPRPDYDHSKLVPGYGAVKSPTPGAAAGRASRRRAFPSQQHGYDGSGVNVGQPGVPLTSHHAASHAEALRNDLLATVEALQRRRADLVSETLIAQYVALYWLEWNGGTLRLTQTGKNVCDQMRAAARTP